jgi:hypothetical protein
MKAQVRATDETCAREQTHDALIGFAVAVVDRRVEQKRNRAAGIRRFEPSELRAWLQRIGFSDYEEVRLGGAFVFRVRRP